MEQRGKQQQFGLDQARPQLVRVGKLAAGLRIGKTRDDAQHAHRVFVDGIGMEQVVLHAPDDAPKCRQVPRQHAVMIHARHRFDGGRALAQQPGEGRVDLGVERQIGADLVERFVDAAHEIGTRCRNLRVFGPHAEQIDQCGRSAHQQVGRIAVEAAGDADEIDIEAHRLDIGDVLYRLLAALQELFAQAFDRDRGTVEILHELLDAEIAPVLVAEAELARQFRW